MIDINLNLPIDTTPTDASTNLIDSNAVFDGLTTKENNLPSIVGNSLKVLRVNAGETAKEWATISSGITIGATTIASGVVGRVLFEGAGNVVQEDSAFFWDNTNKRLGVGATPSTSVRLDVRAQGALSTDIAFRVRNSADTANIMDCLGNGIVRLCSGTSQSEVIIYGEFGYSAGLRTYFNGIQFKYGGGAYGSRFEIANGFLRTNNTDNFILGSGGAFGGGNTQLIILNGTPPTTSGTDQFQLYSADIVAGNAAPHFRTENGSVIKLYKQDLPTSPTNAEIATLLSNLGLANLI